MEHCQHRGFERMFTLYVVNCIEGNLCRERSEHFSAPPKRSVSSLAVKVVILNKIMMVVLNILFKIKVSAMLQACLAK